MAAGLSISEGFPTRLANAIVPVIDVNPKAYKVANIIRSVANSTSGATTVYTTPTDRDFYLTNAYVSYMANATSDDVGVTLQSTAQGELAGIIGIRKLALTAHSNNSEVVYPTPLKLDRGVAIVFSTTFSVGAVTREAGITGYTIEPFENA